MKLIPILFIATILFTSCKKEGCTDSLAENYDQEADKNDNTCTYEGKVTFWLDANSSIEFGNNMVDDLFILIDEVKIGQMTTTSSLLNAPGCGSTGVTHFESLGVDKSKQIKYKVTFEQQTGPFTKEEFTHSEGNIKLEGGKCTTFQIQ